VRGRSLRFALPGGALGGCARPEARYSLTMEEDKSCLEEEAVVVG
jgi:hypothetical protein